MKTKIIADLISLILFVSLPIHADSIQGLIFRIKMNPYVHPEWGVWFEIKQNSNEHGFYLKDDFPLYKELLSLVYIAHANKIVVNVEFNPVDNRILNIRTVR